MHRLNLPPFSREKYVLVFLPLLIIGPVVISACGPFPTRRAAERDLKKFAHAYLEFARVKIPEHKIAHAVAKLLNMV